MAKKNGKFHGSKNTNSGSVFPMQNSIKPVSSIPTGNTGPYGDTMEYADEMIRKNTNYKKSKD